MRTRRFTTVATLATIVLALCPTGSAVAAPATVVATQGACGTFSGPVWTRRNMMTGEELKGTVWKVSASGVPCSVAMTSAKALVKTPFKGEAKTKLKSPKGWTCIAGGGLTGGGKGTAGACLQGPKNYRWEPVLPS